MQQVDTCSIGNALHLATWREQDETNDVAKRAQYEEYLHIESRRAKGTLDKPISSN